MIRLDHLGEEADDAARGVELAALLALRAGELAEKILVDPSEGIVIHRGRDFGNLLQQFLEEGAGEEVVGFGQDAGELRVVLLDVPHRLVDGFARVSALGQCEKVVEPCVGREVEHSHSVVGSGLVQTGTAARGAGGLFQLGALGGEADLGEAQEDEAEDGGGIFLGLQARVGTELIRSSPEPLLQGVGGSVLLRWGNPDHGRLRMWDGGKVCPGRGLSCSSRFWRARCVMTMGCTAPQP